MVKKKLGRKLTELQRGQGIVEFALVIPFLLLVLVGIIEFGFFFFVYSSVNSAAREAARFGAGAGPSAIGVPYYQYCQGIRDAAKRVGVYSGLTDGQVAIGYDSGPGTNQDWTLCLPGTVASSWNPAVGDRVVVRVSVAYDPIVSMLGFPPIQVQALSARTIVRALEIEATPLASATNEPVEGTPEETETGVPVQTGTTTLSPTSTATATPTRTPTDPNTVETPEICLTPLELGGCE